MACGDGAGERRRMDSQLGRKSTVRGTLEGKRWEVGGEEGGECGCGGAEDEREAVSARGAETKASKGELGESTAACEHRGRLAAAGFVGRGSGSGWSRDMAQC